MSITLQGGIGPASRPLIPLTIQITVPSHLNALWIKGFIYVPEDDETKPLNIVFSTMVSIVEGKVTFPSNELSRPLEFQIFAVNRLDQIVAGRRGFATELPSLEATGLELYQC